ncbi:MAG: PAS domain-containing protein [Pseudomonadales bacterium]|jgi:PAS domain S-box-containing protein|nr:PAS domain-containing protein [Pseudomonadales bacterium]
MNLGSQPQPGTISPPSELGSWLARVVDGHYGGYWAWEPASGALWCSDTLLAALGRRREDFPPHYDTFRELLHPEDRTRLEEDLRTHIAAGRAYSLEFRMRHKNGDYRDIDCRTVSEIGADGGRWYVGMMRDVTDERTTQRALEQSEAHFRQLAEDIPGAVFRYVLGTDGRDSVEYMSQGCEAIWEITAEEIQRDPGAVWRRVFDEDIPDLREAIGRSAQELIVWDQVFRIRTDSGQVRWLHGRGTPTRRDDGSTTWNSIVLDISELRTAEAELRESQLRLARASKLEAIGKLTGGIAHDFNNLLAVIVGNAELLEGETDPAELASGLEQILQAAGRGSALTRSLLNFARQAPLAPTPQDLVAVVRDMLQLCRRTVPESISIDTELPSVPCHVVVDRNTLENALLNLVINARDAMMDGGALRLRVRTVSGPSPDWSETGLPEGRFHELAVIDSGTGMAVEVLERAFEPFFSTKGMSEGSGLGLSMVQGFASQSGGAVRIASEPGGGTEVAMLFPVAAPLPGKQPGRVSASAPRLPPLRTLLVEDDPAVRELLAKLLARTGLVVSTAPSGDAALERLDGDDAIELLVTDMVLPGQAQGSDVVRHARARRPGVPILVLTGYAEDAALLEAGAVDAVLTKPAPRDRLFETLDRIIRARSVDS